MSQTVATVQQQFNHGRRPGSLRQFRHAIRDSHRPDEHDFVAQLLRKLQLSAEDRSAIAGRAADLIVRYRRDPEPDLLMQALAGIGLDSPAGVSLLRLSEALLRTPDQPNAVDVMQEQLALASSESPRGGPATARIARRFLALGHRIARGATHRRWLRAVLETGHPYSLRVLAAMCRRYVAAETIEDARGWMQDGGSYTFDMLGEGARNAADMARHCAAYQHAIDAIASCSGSLRHGISIKLSAIEAKFEEPYRSRIFPALLDRLHALADSALARGIAVTIDAEECRRHELLIDLFAALLERIPGTSALGIAVQAYQPRALSTVQWLAELARRRRTPVSVRLVKGAYWDAEIKETQLQGLSGFPVFTTKAHTDLNYLVCAEALFATDGWLSPQFATHNANTMHAVLVMAARHGRPFEFQRLHGMGEGLYAHLAEQVGRELPVRVYAPVGRYEALLPYLVRRLLENGANSSFLNRVLDTRTAPEKLALGPVETMQGDPEERARNVRHPRDLFRPARMNSRGWDTFDPRVQKDFRANMDRVRERPLAQALVGDASGGHQPRALRAVLRPADTNAVIGYWTGIDAAVVPSAVAAARIAFADWSKLPVTLRALRLRTWAQRLEGDMENLVALLVDEAGKTLSDAVAEVREAVDFCRYYAAEAERLMAEPQRFQGPTGETNELSLHGRGAFVCISPWNFPLAILVGQAAAALAAGNSVLAKPAEQTPLIAHAAVRLAHAAGIPQIALQLLLGDGEVGNALVRAEAVAGVLFTGSTVTAKAIQRALAEKDGPIVPMIAETGGINAMIADSTALTEQVTDAAIRSAFGSAGQRCSAVRLLLVQDEVYEKTRTMLLGAMQALHVGDPRDPGIDVGPVIDREALERLHEWIEHCRQAGHAVHRHAGWAGASGYFFGPCIVEIESAEELGEEVFGPVLHLCRFNARNLDEQLQALRATGYGLTLGIQTRREAFKRRVRDALPTGNTYINRDTVGAVVGLQPFGGEGLSGTGPKAGGPHYLLRLVTERVVTENTTAAGGNVELMREST